MYMNLQYSVLLSLYYKEKPEYLRESLDSVFNQTLVSDDVVLVEDGKLGDALEQVVKEYEALYPQLHVIRFDVNRGLGFALNDGLKFCKHELVARMDTDDIAKPYRMEKEVAFMFEHPKIALVGSWIEEFITDINQVKSVRKVPEYYRDVIKYAKKRCPVNHPTVMFRKSEVISVGGYQTKYFPEDYFLWIKMLMNGCEMFNFQESLLWFRYNPSTFVRRGGWKYACDELVTQYNILRMGFISIPRFIVNVGIRFTTRMLPNSLRGFIYTKLLRK